MVARDLHASKKKGASEGTFALHGALQDSRVCVQSNLVQSMPSKEGWA